MLKLNSSCQAQALNIGRRTQKYVVLPVAGPITTSLSSLELYMEALSSSEPWNSDPQIPPIPWRPGLAKSPQRALKLAFIFDDGVVKPQPPIERAARELAGKLKEAGHEGNLPSTRTIK